MTITINGTTGVTYPAGGTDNVAGSGVGTTDSQTLTNKTLTSPAITGATLGVTTFNGGVITSGTAQATTSGTAVGFTGIPSWVKRITIQNNGVVSSGAAPFIQVGSGSYVSTGYNAGYGSGATIVNTTNGILFGASAASWGSITFTLQNSSTNTWVAAGSVWNTSIPFAFVIAGQIALSGTLDRIQISVSSGAFTAGSVNILYEG